jgi:cytoskeletal protein CcmA (bactofilin family)
MWMVLQPPLHIDGLIDGKVASTKEGCLLTQADVNKTVSVVASYQDKLGNAETLTIRGCAKCK